MMDTAALFQQKKPVMQVEAIPTEQQLLAQFSQLHITAAELEHFEENGSVCMVYPKLSLDDFIAFAGSQNITAMYYKYGYPAVVRKKITIPPQVQMRFQTVGMTDTITWGASFGTNLRAKPQLLTREVMKALETCNRRIETATGGNVPNQLVLYAPHPAGHFLAMLLHANVQVTTDGLDYDYDMICRALVVAKEEAGYAYTLPKYSQLEDMKRALFETLSVDDAFLACNGSYEAFLQLAEQLAGLDTPAARVLQRYNFWFSQYECHQLAKLMAGIWQLMQEGVTEYSAGCAARMNVSLYI